MKSVNFEILRDRWRELAELGGFAESYASADPPSALVKLRLFAEKMTEAIYRDRGLPRPERPTFVDLLKTGAFAENTPKVVLDKLHALRIYGNRAAHGEPVRERHALWLLREAHDLARWFCVQHGEARADALPPFSKPALPGRREVRERRRVLERIAAQGGPVGGTLRGARGKARQGGRRRAARRVPPRGPRKPRRMSWASTKRRRAYV